MASRASKIILGVIGILFLVAGAGVGVYLVRQQEGSQDIREKAVSDTGEARIYLSPDSGNHTVDEQFDVDVVIHNPSENNLIVTSANVKLTYPNNRTLSIDQVQPDPNNNLIDKSWRYFNNSFTIEGDNVAVSIVANITSPQGYTIAPQEQMHLARLKFTANRSGSVTLSFDPENTKLFSQTAQGQDVLYSTLPTGTYTVGSGTPDPTEPPATLTPTTGSTTPANSPTPSPIASVSNTPAPTQASSNGVCNFSCVTDTQCTGGLVCEGGKCRNSTCRGDSDCTCDAAGGTSIACTSPANLSTITTRRPVFRGTAAAGARITVTVNSADVITGTTTANSSGAWTWTPPRNLAVGAHTATFVAYDASDRQTTATVNFTISGTGTGTGSSTGTTSTTTASGSATLPVAGNFTPTLVMILGGLILLLSGAISLSLTRRA